MKVTKAPAVRLPGRRFLWECALGRRVWLAARSSISRGGAGTAPEIKLEQMRIMAEQRNADRELEIED